MRSSLGQSPFTRKYFWGSLGKQALNLFFPSTCPICRHTASEPHALCSECFARIHFISDPACSICGHPFEHPMGEEAQCAACLQETPVYDKAWSIFPYNEHTAPLMTRLKFSDRTDLVPLLGRLMHGYGAPVLQERDLVLPVPLHRRRLFKRKYNQSLLLARVVAQEKDIPLLPDMLVRKKHTAPQTGLPRSERKKNVASAFTLHPRYAETVKGKHLLLVDDVMTTGSTLQACALVLKKSGAASIHVLTAARRFSLE